MSSPLRLFLWAGALVGAFFLGRASVTSPPSGELDIAEHPTPSVLNLSPPAASSTASDASGKEPRRGKPTVASLVAAVRTQIQGNGAGFMNPAAMMKVMAPFAELTPEEIKEALSEVERTISAPQQKMMLYAVLLGRLAETDGPAALAYADEHLDGAGPMAQGPRMSAMSTWAQNDPEGAWKYFLEHRDTDEGDGPLAGNRMMLAPLFSSLASQDLQEAFQRLGTLEDSERMMAINGLVQGAAWDAEGRQGLLEAAADLDPESRQALRQQVISQWSMMDPVEALQWAQSVPEDERSPLIHAAVGPLMMTDPENGASALLQAAPNSEKPGIYADIVSHWASRDPNAAGEWLGTQPQGPELDQARARFSAAVAERDPESAMAWAQTVENPDHRMGAVGNTYRQWVRRDPDGANTALENSSLNDEQRSAIRASASNGNP